MPALVDLVIIDITSMHPIVLVAIGGAVGALLRYGISGAAHRLMGPSFPWGTLTVNVLGCVLIGVVWAVMEESALAPAVRLFVLTGVLGAFTTFSTFGLETLNLLREGEVTLGVLNVAASNGAGLLAVAVGLFVGKAVASLGGTP